MSSIARGPRVVAIGGGHGLARSLRAIRRYAGLLTAITTVADDGGSSGRLRDAFGIPAPGDLRRCLGALAPDDSLLAKSLEHRFAGGELEGHAFGNVLIAALAATSGDFVSGITEAGALLGVDGSVYPATTGSVVLTALSSNGAVSGQVNVMETRGITQIALDPPDAESPVQAVDAILDADQIVIGPGSLFTSVLAACAPTAIREAIEKSEARRVYVANLREQVPETAGFDVAMHVAALVAHGVNPDVVLADTRRIDLGQLDCDVVVLDTALSDRTGAAHDEVLLAAALRGAMT